MKRLLLIAALTFSVAASVRPQSAAGSSTGPVNYDRAKHKVDFSISPFIGKGFGYTKWVMKESGYDTTIDAFVSVQSELEYPLNAVYGGVELQIGAEGSAFRDWSVKLVVGTNFNDPSNVMKDHDWITIPGYFDGKISYTESRVKMSSLLEVLEGQLVLTRSRVVRFGLTGGIRYQHFDQKLYGLTGWQLDDSLRQFNFEVLQDTLVGAYEITYTMPNIGPFCKFQFNRVSRAELRGTLVGAFVSDEDYHLLRNRIATASGVGLGFMGAVKIRVAPELVTRGSRPFIEVEGELLVIDAKPTQKIYWYGDDPISAGNDTGNTLYVSHHITSKQGYITARVGLTF